VSRQLLVLSPPDSQSCKSGAYTQSIAFVRLPFIKPSRELLRSCVLTGLALARQFNQFKQLLADCLTFLTLRKGHQLSLSPAS
jgi:hypothetical protein